MAAWYEENEFWKNFSPVLFDARRWEAVPTEIDELLTLANIAPGAPVLDLCCGPGRHSLELARRGFTVTGVDRTTRYLAEARRSAAAEELSIEFVERDMRRFRRPAAFDLAINLYTSFGYFEDKADDEQVARNLYESLKPRGKLVLEMMGKEVLARVFQERAWFWLDEEAGVMMLEERKLCQGWGWIESTWTLIYATERFSHTVGHRLYAGTELAALLRQAGFAKVELFGGLDGIPYDHNARRLVAIAEK